MLSRIFSSVYDFFGNLFSAGLGFITDLFSYFFQKLFDFLKLLLSPFVILISIIFYFIAKLGLLVLKLFAVLLGIGKIFVALVKGIFATLAGFSYTATTPEHGQWTSIFHNVVQGLDTYQLDTVAYIFMFIIWFITAFAAIRIIASMRGGE